MTILHITTVHKPQDIRIYHKECMSLALAGYKVTLIAKQDKNQSNSPKIKILTIKTRNNRLARLLLSAKDAFVNAIKAKATIIHFHDPELIPVGILLRILGKKVVYDVHEDLPRQIMSKYWINPILRQPIAWFAALVEYLSSRLFFSNIVCATPRIAKRFPEKKVTLVQNFPILNEVNINDPIPWEEHKHQLAYVGGIDITRGIIENLNVLDSLSKTLDIKLMLAGPFSNLDIEQKCKQHPGWKQVDYHPWLAREPLIQKISQSIAGLVILHPTPAYIHSLPIKMFEYMLAGIPVIASDFPLWRKIIEESNCGILVDPTNQKDLEKAITWVINHPKEAEAMGKNGQKAVLEKYNWNQEAKKLINLYKQLET